MSYREASDQGKTGGPAADPLAAGMRRRAASEQPTATILSYQGKEPRIAPDAYLAPTAVLIGDVIVEEGASVWFGAVLRGDFDRIVVGAGSCIQDNTVIHTNAGLPTLVGPNVTVGHLSLLEGCVIEEGALIGMGSIVLNRARVGKRAMLAAGSVVVEDTEVSPEVLAAGAPAKVKKPLDGKSSEWVESAAREYQSLRLRYMHGSGEPRGDTNTTETSAGAEADTT